VYFPADTRDGLLKFPTNVACIGQCDAVVARYAARAVLTVLWNHNNRTVNKPTSQPHYYSVVIRTGISLLLRRADDIIIAI
jgi:hypothetical protein